MDGPWVDTMFINAGPQLLLQSSHMGWFGDGAWHSMCVAVLCTWEYAAPVLRTVCLTGSSHGSCTVGDVDVGAAAVAEGGCTGTACGRGCADAVSIHCLSSSSSITSPYRAPPLGLTVDVTYWLLTLTLGHFPSHHHQAH